MSTSTAETPPDVRLARNAGLNLAGQGIPILVAVGTMPVVVRGLGPADFGLLALAWTVVGYAGSFDLGLGRAATRQVAAARWAGDTARVARVAATALVAQAALGLLVGAVLWLLAGALGGLLLPGAAPGAGATLIRLLALAVPAVLLSNGLRAALEGLNRFDLVNYARTPTASAVFLVPFAGVLAGWSLAGIVAALVLTRYVAAALFALFWRRAAGPGAWAAATLPELRRLLAFGGWVALSNALIPLVVHLERFVVSALRGPVALAYYAAPHELVSRLNVVPAAVAVVLFPAFSGLAGQGDRQALLRRVRQGVRLIPLLLAPPLAALIVLAAPLLTVWLGADYGVTGAAVLRLLALALLLSGIAFVPFALIEGVGRPAVVALYHLVELPLYAALLWFLVSRFGITGAAAAWTLRMAVTTPLFFWIGARTARLGFRATAGGTVARTVGAALLLQLAAFAAAALLAAPAALLAAAILLPAGFAAAAWFWLLEGEDRDMLRAAVRRLRSRHRLETLATDG